MMLFRRAKDSDLEPVLQFAKAHGQGITTLARDKPLLNQMLQWSNRSFSSTEEVHTNSYYFFVLEDTNNHRIVGTSAIKAHVGFDTPFYTFKLFTNTQCHYPLKLRCEHQLLQPVNDYEGCTELGTLLLDPAYRGEHNGRLLSKGRFLFMAQYPKRFAAKVIAEMRGACDPDGIPFFWQAVGRHFFHLPFEQADRLILKTNKQFIADLMPRSPLYVSLMPREVQEAMGKTHKDTAAAYTMLCQEGFSFHGYVHVFDVGPTLEVPLNDIRSIRQSRVLTLNGIKDLDSAAQLCIIANTQLDFKALVHQATLEEETCTISPEAADLLQVVKGSQLRLRPLS